MLKGILKEEKDPEDPSLTRAIWFVAFGTIFAFWVAHMLGPFLPVFPTTPWEEVEGYFHFAVVVLIPAGVLYFYKHRQE